MLVIAMTDNFLVTVDRFSGKLGLLSTAIDRVMERFAPINQAVGCGHGPRCRIWCEWTEACCCDVVLPKNEQKESHAIQLALCGTEDEWECSNGCPSSCGTCGC